LAQKCTGGGDGQKLKGIHFSFYFSNHNTPNSIFEQPKIIFTRWSKNKSCLEF
jgi:hypothetical protein